MQANAFNAYDPRTSGYANNFDPRVQGRYNNANGNEAGTTVADAKPGQKMQINLTLNNPTASNLTFEMFSYLFSQLRTQKQEYIVGAHTYIPITSLEGITAVAANAGGVVGFDQTGTLFIQGAPANPRGTIGCGEIPYASLFAASGITAFDIAYFRMTTTNQPQIDQNLTWFRRTMAGGVQENRISPRAYFRPNQFQNLTIDLTVSLSIGIDSGLRMVVLAGQSVTLGLFISAWTNQALN